MHFWKYASSFRKNDRNPIELENDGNHLTQSCEVKEACAAYFKSVFTNHCMHIFYTDFQSSDSPPITSVYDSDVLNTIWCLHPSKSDGFDGIPTFFLKGCLDILIPVLKFIFNLSSSQQIFPTLWKQAAVFPIFKEGKAALVN